MGLISQLMQARSKLAFSMKFLKKFTLKLLRQAPLKQCLVSKTRMKHLIFLKTSFLKCEKTQARD